MAKRRLKKEFEKNKKDPPSSCSVGLVNDDLLHWHGTIIGPIDSPYYGGIFNMDIKITDKYPYEPPKVKFITPVYHPNIDKEGNICLSILKNEWSSVLTIEKVLLSISSLLTDPNPKDPLEHDIAFQYETDIEAYKESARQYTQLYASN